MDNITPPTTNPPPPTTNNTSPSNSSTTPPAPNSKRRPLLYAVILLSVLILTASAVAAYHFLYQKPILPEAPSPTPAPYPEPLLTASPTPTDTTNWDSYVIDNYQFKLPPEFKPTENQTPPHLDFISTLSYAKMISLDLDGNAVNLSCTTSNHLQETVSINNHNFQLTYYDGLPGGSADCTHDNSSQYIISAQINYPEAKYSDFLTYRTNTDFQTKEEANTFLNQILSTILLIERTTSANSFSLNHSFTDGTPYIHSNPIFISSSLTYPLMSAPLSGTLYTNDLQNRQLIDPLATKLRSEGWEFRLRHGAITYEAALADGPTGGSEGLLFIQDDKLQVIYWTLNNCIETLSDPGCIPSSEVFISEPTPLESIYPQFDHISTWPRESYTHTQALMLHHGPGDFEYLPIRGTLFTHTQSRLSPSSSTFDQTAFMNDLTQSGWSNEVITDGRTYRAIIADGPTGGEQGYLKTTSDGYLYIITVSTHNNCTGVPDNTTDCSYSTSVFISHPFFTKTNLH